MGGLILVLLLGLVLPVPGAAGPSATVSPGPSAGGAARPNSAAPANCSALATGWSLLDAGLFAPDVAGGSQSPCAVGHDVPALYFVSNATHSGARTQVIVSLPAAGSSPASAFAAFWVGLWVAGVPCSLGGLSYLTVEFLPPYTVVAGVPPSAGWSLVAPVWDLAPPGTCDSQCQNDSAFVTVAGRSYCEDDAVLNGVGSLGGVASDRFAPGDLVTLAFVGVAGSGTPLAVYANDSTHPLDSLGWSYPAASTVSGRALAPFYDTASPGNGGWTGGLDVGVGWQNCPSSASMAPSSRCNSYDGPVVAAAGAPQVDLVTSYNATTHAYSAPYASVVTRSSSGACSGRPGTSSCQGFTTYGGTGAYPLFSVAARSGRAWFAYGAPTSDTVSTFGGVAAQFPSSGNLSSLESTTAVSAFSYSVGSSSVAITARLSDPYGVAEVNITGWFCTSGGIRQPTTAPAVPSNSPGNSRLDGNWSANLATNGFTGEFYVSLIARSSAGILTAPYKSNFTITGGGSTCPTVAPPASTVNASTVQPLGGGYALSWITNLSAGVTSYEVVATPPLGGTPIAFPEGNVTSARVFGLKGNTSYLLQMVATNPAGLSTLGPSASAPNTYYPLQTKPLMVTTSSTWVNQTTATLTANVTGGLPPFTFFFDFGDGTLGSVFTTSGQGSVTHPFATNYSGNARISVVAADAAGDTIPVPVTFIPVLATPLAPATSIAAGNGFVDASWGLPALPPGLVPTNYSVYWTTDAAWAPYLTVAWPTNGTVPAIHVQRLPPTAVRTSLPVPNGVTAYVQVVAWDVFGEGQLPSEPAIGEEPVPSAIPAPFASGTGIVVQAAGGPAPFTAQFSTEFTTGSGSVVVNATYRFSDGGSVVAPISQAGTAFFANATYTFQTPGVRAVYLYAVDSVSELLLLTSSVAVSPGAAPLVALSVNPTPVFVNTSVQLSAAPTGGSGQYSYAWDLGDGQNATGPALSHTYSAAGTYLVKVVVTDSLYGGVTTATDVLSVYAPATVAIGVVPGAQTGEYVLAAFATGGYGALSYVWLFGDGNQGAGVRVTHTWAASGTYRVTLRASDLYGHTVVATTNLTVPSTTAAPPPISTGLTTLDDGLLVGLVVLGAALAVVLVRKRRPPSPRPAVDDGVYRDAAPSADLTEETPTPYK